MYKECRVSPKRQLDTQLQLCKASSTKLPANKSRCSQGRYMVSRAAPLVKAIIRQQHQDNVKITPNDRICTRTMLADDNGNSNLGTSGYCRCAHRANTSPPAAPTRSDIRYRTDKSKTSRCEVKLNNSSTLDRLLLNPATRPLHSPLHCSMEHQLDLSLLVIVFILLTTLFIILVVYLRL